MICFPNAKINLGLQVLSRRPDGFHNLNSLMLPVPLFDVLEFIPAKEFSFHSSGLNIPGNIEENLVVKAWQLMHEEYEAPAVQVHLHKCIPALAGLGGGSADASFLMTTLNEYFKLKIPILELEEQSLQLGTDCPFFIQNKATVVSGRGENLQRIEFDLRGHHLAIVKPEMGISTKDAFGLLDHFSEELDIPEILEKPIKNWRRFLHNDFEKSVFRVYPELKSIKEKLYNSGAKYAALSGSGSAFFGVFDTPPNLTNFPSNCYLWRGKF